MILETSFNVRNEFLWAPSGVIQVPIDNLFSEAFRTVNHYKKLIQFFLPKSVFRCRKGKLLTFVGIAFQSSCEGSREQNERHGNSREKSVEHSPNIRVVDSVHERGQFPGARALRPGFEPLVVYRSHRAICQHVQNLNRKLSR